MTRPRPTFPPRTTPPRPPAATEKTTSPSDSEKAFRERIVEEARPWGRFRVYPSEGAASLKIITIDPGGALSLQYHRRRAEFWVILDEGLEITVDGRTWRPSPNEEIHIPREAAHRVRCLGDRPARIMEIWLGNSDESDIVRLEDRYGRT